MKKTIAFLTSLAALCSLISCEENEIEDIKGDNEIIQEETVPTETPTEADLPFREYKAEDFTDIKVKLTMQQTAPPVKVEEYDLSWIEFEPKIPLCALPENRSIEKFMPYYKSDAENYDMTPEEYAAQMSAPSGTPTFSEAFSAVIRQKKGNAEEKEGDKDV